MWNVCYTTRREQLLKGLAERELPALLVSNPCNVTYLSGFSGHDSYLLVSPSRTVMFSDTRYATQLRDECPGLQVEIRDAKSTMMKELSRRLPQFGLKSVGIEGDYLTHDQFTRLSEEMAEITLVPQTSLVETLRQIKDESEIEEIRKAVDQAQRGFELVKASLLLDQTELQVAFDLEHGMRRFGAYRAAFEPIIAAGARAALPHARATNQRLSGACEVLFDWGSQTLRGYRSDLTRVGVIGKLSPELDAVYRLVLKAQQTAIGLIRPGMLCREIDSAARRVIDEGGYGAFFGHGLGHGIGLEVHEGPRLSPISQEILQPGMIVTVEPGIYLPDIGGVRLEDDVLVTPDGFEILSDLPKDVETVLLHG